MTYKIKRFSQLSQYDFQDMPPEDSEQIGPIIKGVGKFVMKSMKKSKGKSKNMGRKQPPGRQSTDLTKAQKRDQELIKKGKLDPESVTEMDGATSNDISAAIQAENSKKPKIIPPKNVKTKPKNYGVKYSDTNDYCLTSFSGYKVKRFSQDSESKNEYNAGKGAALIGGLGLAGTGTAVGLAKKDTDNIVSDIYKRLNEDIADHNKKETERIKSVKNDFDETRKKRLKGLLNDRREDIIDSRNPKSKLKLSEDYIKGEYRKKWQGIDDDLSNKLKKEIKHIKSNTDKYIREDERMAKASSNIAKQVGKSKMIKRGAIGLAATGLAAGGYYLAKKKMDKK